MTFLRPQCWAGAGILPVLPFGCNRWLCAYLGRISTDARIDMSATQGAVPAAQVEAEVQAARDLALVQGVAIALELGQPGTAD